MSGARPIKREQDDNQEDTMASRRTKKARLDEVKDVMRSIRENKQIAYNEKSVEFLQNHIRYKDNKLYVHTIQAARLIGHRGLRMGQIARESRTYIRVAPGSGWRECIIRGFAGRVKKAQAIIEKLFQDFESGDAEKDRLDEAALQHLAEQEAGTTTGRTSDSSSLNRTSSPKAGKHKLRASTQTSSPLRPQSNPQASVVPRVAPFRPYQTLPALGSSARANTANVSKTRLSIRPRDTALDLPGVSDDSSSSESSSEEEEIPPRSSTRVSAVTMSRLNGTTTPIAQGSNIKVSSEDSSSDDHDDEEEVNSPPPKPAQSKLHPTNAVRGPLQPSFQLSDNADIIEIKSEPESEAEHSSSIPQTPPTVAQSPSATRITRSLGLAPINGTVDVEEVKTLESEHAHELSKLNGTIKRLEFMLHYEGVTDWQMTRFRRLAGSSSDWSATLQDIVGHARKGRKADGEPVGRVRRRR